MNFSVKQLQLKHIALIKVSASLWNQCDIRALVIEFSDSPLFTKLEDYTHSYLRECPRRKEWQKIEDRVMKKVPQLMIPACLKEKILSFIQAVGFQILKWLEYHRKVCHLDLDLPNEFCWTPQGIIDKKETSRFLIKDEHINIITRYKLACFYFMEDNILELWNKMNENDRISLSSDESISQRRYLDFWKCYITLESNCRPTYYKYMLQYAADNGNKAAIEYFLQRIHPTETYLVKIILCVLAVRGQAETYPKIYEPPKEYLTEILCFLLSQMNNEHQMKIFKGYYFKVLCSFLDWPFQSFYVEIASHLDLLSEMDYCILLLMIIRKVNLGYKDYPYHELFRNFWQIIPHAAKNEVINGAMITVLLGKLLEIKDKENLKLILQNATVIQKQRFVFSEEGKYLCECLVSCEEWDLFRFFLKLCISSKNKMTRFKDKFEAYLQARECRIIEKSKYDECYRLLNDLINGYDKRKCTDDDSARTKRLCCIEFKDMMHSVDK